MSSGKYPEMITTCVLLCTFSEDKTPQKNHKVKCLNSKILWGIESKLIIFKELPEKQFDKNLRNCTGFVEG